MMGLLAVAARQNVRPYETTAMTMTVVLPLQALPLRPSTLSTLLRAGFRTTEDLRSSRGGLGGGGGGSLSNFASECNVGLAEAGRLWREVEEAAARRGGGGGADMSYLGASSGDDKANTTVTAGQVRPRPGSRRVTAAALLTNPSAAAGSAAVARSGATTATTTAAGHQSSIRHIVTFCRSLDALLGGGVALSELTELSGSPGAGKTQLAMQLCVDARLPAAYGGVGGEAVYVDTEGSFSPERCYDMAEALVRHVRRSAGRRQQAAAGRARTGSTGGSSSTSSANANSSGTSTDAGILPPWFNPATILGGIHVIRVHDMAAQICAVRNLAALLRSRRDAAGGGSGNNGNNDNDGSGNNVCAPIKAIVVDSVAFHYRASPHESSAGNNSSSWGGRTKSLTRLAATLADLAREFDVAVLAVNQMTTKVGGGSGSGSGGALLDHTARSTSGGGGNGIGQDENGVGSGGGGGDWNSSSRLTPALGESWSHSTTTRLLLTQVRQGGGGSGKDTDEGGGDLRRCRLVKCPHKATGVADFQVNGLGIRDVAPAVPANANGNAPPGGGAAGSGAGRQVTAVEQAKRQRIQ